MIASIAIDVACLGDAEAIAALHRACLGDEWQASAIAELMRQSTAICRVARVRLDIAGFALCRAAADECEVLCCAVDAGFRRHGTARLLLRGAFDEALRRGARSVFLEVAADNAPARALYAALDFEVVGRRPHYYQRPSDQAVDALIMRRGL